MNMNRVPLVMILVIAVLGCQSTMEPVSGPGDPPVQLSIVVGDTVRVLTKHGDRPTFKVTDITEDALIGEKHSVRYEDMAFVEKRSEGIRRANTVGAVLALVAGAVVLQSISEVPPGFPSVQ